MTEKARDSLIAVVLGTSLCHCAAPDNYKGLSDGSISVGSGAGSSGSGSGSGGACSVAWQGATRSFGAALALSTDPAASVVQTLFLPGGVTEAVMLEPTAPDLILVAVDSSAAKQRIDSVALPVSPGASVSVDVPVDASDAVIAYGAAVTFVSSAGQPYGPFSLANAGLLSVSSVVALEAGAGAVVLGLDSSGPVWTTLGATGFGVLNPIDLGVTPDATPPAMVLWDDGQGDLSALLEVSYDSGASLGLFALRGSGSPFLFGAPVALDAEAPGQVRGFTMTLGPSGELGVLLVEGSSPELAGYVVSGTGALVGGLLAPLSAPLAFPPLSAMGVPWAAPCAVGVCDPALRFGPDGELIAAWTLAGELSLSRLPAGATAWQSPQLLSGGPLISALAVDGSDDVVALAQGSGGQGLVVGPAGAAPLFEPLPQEPGFTPAAFVAATSAGTGALWGLQSMPQGAISGETFSAVGHGSPAVVTGVSLPAGELPTSLVVAASSVTSSAGPAFSGVAVPGWMLIGANAGSAGDLLLASADPASGAVGAPTSVAVSGWQQTSGVGAGVVFVDPQGDALVVFDQAGSGTSGPSLYFAAAPAGGAPSAACAPLAPQGNASLAVEVDQVPYGPNVLAGSGRIVVHGDSPVTASLAQ